MKNQNPFVASGGTMAWDDDSKSVHAVTQPEYPHDEVETAMGAPTRDHAAIGNLFRWVANHGSRGIQSHRALAVRVQAVRYFLKAGTLRSLAREIGVTKARICQAVGDFAAVYGIKLESMRSPESKAAMSQAKTQWHKAQIAAA